MFIDFQTIIVILLLAAFVIFLIPVLLLLIHIYYPYLIYGFNISKDTPDDYNIQYKEIVLSTDDGIRLHCWDMPNGDNKEYVVVCHGVASTKNIYLDVAQMFYSAGYSVFMADFRAHGKSKWAKITYGYNEIQDIKAIISYLKSQGVEKIATYGHSMGAAVTLIAAAKYPDINLLICDGCFVSVEKILKFRMFFLPSFIVRFLYQFSEKLAWMIFKVKLSDIKPIEALKTIYQPIMYICGLKDFNIPSENSKILYEHTQTAKHLYEIPDTTHQKTMKVEGYKEEMIAFMQQNF